ncbi:hypothetical protein BDFB_013762 [Asbolus verrucosus]|uniref:Uncharacterized protein n=1 Tax=Asbolus verrucosus TaxID=1661398 RepID=A0A482W3X6_ASBVE|nr:hypothetical protein BDFB_013762 [Asbolus verrucosus]
MVLTAEHKIFLINSYYRNGIQGDNGEWNYSIPACIAEFQEAYRGVAENHDYNNSRKTIQYFIV